MQGLEGVRVLELGEGVPAAYAAKLMADLGADVVKLEPPGGDRTRRRGPFAGAPDPDASGSFLALNTNKRAAVVEPGRVDELAAEADILIHNLPAARHGDWGLDIGGLRRRHPRLVVCSVTPFGLDGPYRDLRGEELTVNHGGGWGWLSPGASDRADLPPLKPFGSQAEIQAGTAAAIAALAAFDRAERSGFGEHIDLSIMAHVASMLEAAFIAWSYPGFVADRLGIRTLNPWKIFRCRDGLIFLVAVEQDQWERLVELMGNPEWATEELFATPAARNDNADAVNLLVESWTEQQSVEWLWHEGQRRRICFAPVLTMADVARQPHLAERGAFVHVDHPVAGRVRQIGPPMRLARPWWEVRRPAPLLDEHRGEGFTDRPAGQAGGSGGPVREPVSGARPLEGVRVLDLSWVWAGPFATMQLAHLGADVIKVETAGRPCLGRRLPFHPPGVAPTLDTSGYFNQWNQGKRSVSIDLSHPGGVELVKRLVAEVDVVIDNFAAGVMERMGLGDGVLRAIKEDLVNVSITGYGQTGPCREYMGYGPTAAPLCGLASLTGYPGGEPCEVGIAYGDPAAGIMAAWGVVSAVVARRRTGEGQRVDVALWEATLAAQPEGWMSWAMTGEQPPRIGNRDLQWSPHNCYRCADDATAGEAGAWVSIACTTEEEWQALCSAVDPGLAADPRFGSAALRKANEDELDAALESWTSSRDRWEVTSALQGVGVAAFPSMSPRDLAGDRHLEARGFLERLEHPAVGVRTHTGIPWVLESGPNGVRGPAPMLGQHTDEVLGELLGLTGEDIDKMRADGVLR